MSINGLDIMSKAIVSLHQEVHAPVPNEDVYSWPRCRDTEHITPCTQERSLEGMTGEALIEQQYEDDT
jgi:hypothetical protein